MIDELELQEAESAALDAGVAYGVGELPSGLFRTIVVDPPWSYRDRMQRSANRRGIAPFYSTMTHRQLRALPVGEWAAPAAHLYLWTTNAFLAQAHDLVKRWGFNQKTVLTWVKVKTGRGRELRVAFGMGHFYRNATEHVIFATRGSAPTLRRDRSTVILAPRGRHSAKPEAFYDLVEEMSPGPFLDVFARRQRLSWSTWGDECFVAEGLPDPQSLAEESPAAPSPATPVPGGAPARAPPATP